jgi:hypothetical protein
MKKNGLFFILILLLFISACTYVPECGNGVIDQDENSESCCLDVGCGDDAECVNNECFAYEPAVELDCTADSDCLSDEICSDNACEELECNSCEYIDNHDCKEYLCCDDDDCDDGDSDTVDSCQQTEDGDSYCLSSEYEDEEECTRDSDCDNGYECESNECVEEPECTSDSDCDTGYECNNDECEEIVDDLECTINSDCDQGYECSSEECVVQTSTECDDDWDCLVTQSETCSLAEFDFSLFTELFGVEQSTNSYYEVQGYENNLCEFYVTYVDLRVDYSDAVIQSLIDGGMTMEEVQQQEDDLNVLYDGLEGREGSCMFETEDLNAMLERWSNGDFSGGAVCSLDDDEWDCTLTGDWADAESCQGEYFNPNL